MANRREYIRRLAWCSGGGLVGGGILLYVGLSGGFSSSGAGLVPSGVGLLLLAYGAFCARALYHTATNPPYVPVGRVFRFEKGFIGHTNGSFTVVYHLTGLITVVDNAAFIASEMLDWDTDELRCRTQDWFLEEFYARHFEGFLYETGFSGYGWPHYAGKIRLAPQAWRYRFCGEKDGKQLYKPDLNCTDTVKDSQRLEYRNNGCTVGVQLMKVLVEKQQIERSFGVLAVVHREVLLEAVEDQLYRFTEECSAVAALKRQQEISETMQRLAAKQSWSAHGVTVDTEQSGETVKMSWRFADNCPAGYELLGFRLDGSSQTRQAGFVSADWQNEANNGILRVHDHDQRGGIAIEQLAGGNEYFYTFVLKSKSRPAQQKDAPVQDFDRQLVARFSLRLPTAAERRQLLEEGLHVKELEKRLDQKLSGKAADDHDPTLAEDLRKIRQGTNRYATLMSMQAADEDGINKCSGYTAEQKKTLIDYVRRKYESAMESLEFRD